MSAATATLSSDKTRRLENAPAGADLHALEARLDAIGIPRARYMVGPAAVVVFSGHTVAARGNMFLVRSPLSNRVVAAADVQDVLALVLLGKRPSSQTPAAKP